MLSVHQYTNCWSKQIDNFTFHMGVNATPIVGKTRVTQPIANSLDRLVLDCEKAKALAMKLEEELLGDDEDGVQPEGEDSEPKLPGLRERGSVMIEETTARILAKHELDEEELNEEQRVRRVGFSK